MAQENQCAQIEKTCNADNDLELNKQDCLVKSVMTFLCMHRSRCQIVKYEAVCHVVHQAHEEDADNQSEEKQVVLLANAVIKPYAMMVEFVDASIAFAAVF